MFGREKFKQEEIQANVYNLGRKIEANREIWSFGLQQDLATIERDGAYRPFAIDLRLLMNQQGQFDQYDIETLRQKDPDYDIDGRLDAIYSNPNPNRQSLYENNTFANCDLKKTGQYKALRQVATNRAQEIIVEELFDRRGEDLLATGWRPYPSWAPDKVMYRRAQRGMWCLYNYYKDRQEQVGIECQTSLEQHNIAYQQAMEQLNQQSLRFRTETIAQRRKVQEAYNANVGSIQMTLKELLATTSDQKASNYYEALHIEICRSLLHNPDYLNQIVNRTLQGLHDFDAQKRSVSRAQRQEMYRNLRAASNHFSRAGVNRVVVGTLGAAIAADKSRRWVQKRTGMVGQWVGNYVTREIEGSREALTSRLPYEEVERAQTEAAARDKKKMQMGGRAAAGMIAIVGTGGAITFGHQAPAHADENDPWAFASTSAQFAGDSESKQMPTVPKLPDSPMPASSDFNFGKDFINSSGLGQTSAPALPTSAIGGTPVEVNTAPAQQPNSQPNQEKILGTDLKKILNTIDTHGGNINIDGKQYNLGNVITLKDGTVLVSAPQYIQFDGSWSDNSYFNSTIGYAGCFPTAEATVVRALTGKTNVNPGVMASFNQQNGVGSGEHEAFTYAAHAYGLPIATYGKYESDKVRAVLQGGGLLIATGRNDNNDKAPFTRDGHAIVIRGIRPDNTLILADPNYHGNDIYSYRKIISDMNDFPHFYAFWPKR